MILRAVKPSLRRLYQELIRETGYTFAIEGCMQSIGEIMPVRQSTIKTKKTLTQWEVKQETTKTSDFTAFKTAASIKNNGNQHRSKVYSLSKL